MLFVEDVKLTVQKLASVTVRAVGSGMELSAKFGFVIGRKVDFLNQLVSSMCERTVVFEFASARDFPVSAHLSLLLHLILSDEIVSFLFTFELLLGLFHSCYF